VEAAQQAGLAADELNTIRVFQANTPSVVNVTNIRAMQSYYSMDVERIPAGTGSGFVWDSKGEPCGCLVSCLCVLALLRVGGLLLTEVAVQFSSWIVQLCGAGVCC
jgi:hypothetical protein